MTLEQTLAAVQTGAIPANGLRMDSEAFTGFYERAAKPLWAYLLRVSGDAALAEDLMQESFVKFLCASTPRDGEVEARKYLFTIATNLMRDHWRRPVQSSIEDVPEGSLAAKQGTGDASLTLGPALAKLKPRERQLLWLAHAEGYSHREVAEVMGIGTASVRLLLFRARRKMAALLAKEVA